jgi:hypothetical protein
MHLELVARWGWVDTGGWYGAGVRRWGWWNVAIWFSCTAAARSTINKTKFPNRHQWRVKCMSPIEHYAAPNLRQHRLGNGDASSSNLHLPSIIPSLRLVVYPTLL